jgi:hypothetical protein
MATEITPKMLATRKLLAERFHAGFGAGKECVVILDMVRYTMTANPIPSFMRLPGFRSLQSTWIRPPKPGEFRAYGRAHWFQRIGSGMKFCVESNPREPWLAPYSVSIFADDETGLLPDEVFSLRELMPEAKLTLLEIAVDFPLVKK